jgi:hypothetical protein
VLGSLTALVGADPGYVPALVDVLTAFLRRNTGRRVHLRVGDVELTIDQPTRGENAELISIARDAIERLRR